MNPTLMPDHNRAAITLCSIVALNTKNKSGRTLNKIEIAQVLSKLLQIYPRVPSFWLQGDFKKNPFSRENFLKFVRAYQGKPGLETYKEIVTLAVALYGREYKKAIDLLELPDREIFTEESFQPQQRNLAEALSKVIELSSPESVKRAVLELGKDIDAIHPPSPRPRDYTVEGTRKNTSPTKTI